MTKEELLSQHDCKAEKCSACLHCYGEGMIDKEIFEYEEGGLVSKGSELVACPDCKADDKEDENRHERD